MIDWFQTISFFLIFSSYDRTLILNSSKDFTGLIAGLKRYMYFSATVSLGRHLRDKHVFKKKQINNDRGQSSNMKRVQTQVKMTRSRGYKTLFILNSTIVGVLTIISMIYSTSESYKARNVFIY